ncbi:unnamed protein product [Amoebophrya sp. A120]|nr:unnamed protein product [Amoebophrya sp. A120]|eukprot:GSA120T00013860001.1
MAKEHHSVSEQIEREKTLPFGLGRIRPQPEIKAHDWMLDEDATMVPRSFFDLYIKPNLKPPAECEEGSVFPDFEAFCAKGAAHERAKRAKAKEDYKVAKPELAGDENADIESAQRSSQGSSKSKALLSDSEDAQADNKKDDEHGSQGAGIFYQGSLLILTQKPEIARESLNQRRRELEELPPIDDKLSDQEYVAALLDRTRKVENFLSELRKCSGVLSYSNLKRLIEKQERRLERYAADKDFKLAYCLVTGLQKESAFFRPLYPQLLPGHNNYTVDTSSQNASIPLIDFELIDLGGNTIAGGRAECVAKNLITGSAFHLVADALCLSSRAEEELFELFDDYTNEYWEGYHGFLQIPLRWTLECAFGCKILRSLCKFQTAAFRQFTQDLEIPPDFLEVEPKCASVLSFLGSPCIDLPAAGGASGSSASTGASNHHTTGGNENSNRAAASAASSCAPSNVSSSGQRQTFRGVRLAWSDLRRATLRKRVHRYVCRRRHRLSYRLVDFSNGDKKDEPLKWREYKNLSVCAHPLALGFTIGPTDGAIISAGLRRRPPPDQIEVKDDLYHLEAMFLQLIQRTSEDFWKRLAIEKCQEKMLHTPPLPWKLHLPAGPPSGPGTFEYCLEYDLECCFRTEEEAKDFFDELKTMITVLRRYKFDADLEKLRESMRFDSDLARGICPWFSTVFPDQDAPISFEKARFWIDGLPADAHPDLHKPNFGNATWVDLAKAVFPNRLEKQERRKSKNTKVVSKVTTCLTEDDNVEHQEVKEEDTAFENEELCAVDDHDDEECVGVRDPIRFYCVFPEEDENKDENEDDDESEYGDESSEE